MSDDRFTRVKWLFGDENVAKFATQRVVIFGLGGVGGICVDALFRSGFSNFCFVDKDIFETTNLNRQLHSEHLGEFKAEVFAKIYKGKAVKKCVDMDFLRGFELANYDIVIDAIDDIPAKVALASLVSDRQIFVSATGGAKKIDPTRVKIAPLSKSYGDALAKKFRYELKKAGVKRDFEVVFSDEKPLCRELGSFMGVTAAVGLALASLVLRKVLENKAL